MKTLREAMCQVTLRKSDVRIASAAARSLIGPNGGQPLAVVRLHGAIPFRADRLMSAHTCGQSRELEKPLGDKGPPFRI